MKINRALIAVLLAFSVFIAGGCSGKENRPRRKYEGSGVTFTYSPLETATSGSAVSSAESAAAPQAPSAPAVSSTPSVESETQPRESSEQAKIRIEQPAGSDTVYRTPSGSRFHLISTCGGENSYEVTREQALAAGLTPCQKCADTE